MKRVLSVMVVVIMMLTVVACSHANNVSTWQEQYDLGVRYLSEGNYEEAIIAFSSAIEIDSKQALAYVGLSDAYISAGDYTKADEVVAAGKEACGDDENFDRVLNNLSFLQSGDAGIKITSFYFDEEAFLAGEETDFLVSVAYCCPEGENCILMIGANTEDPYSFTMMDKEYQVAGSGGYQFHVSVMPVQWEETYFGIYVNLSEANHAGTLTPFAWDTLYIDQEGYIFGFSDTEDNSLTEQDTTHEELTEYERNHILFEELSLTDQELVSHITELLINEDEEGLYATLDSNPNIDLGYIDCGDYRIYVNASYEVEKGDESESFHLELRTENATGYSVKLYSSHTIEPSQLEWTVFPSGWEYYYDTEWTTFQCQDWQLGCGEIVSRFNNPSKWCRYDNQDFHVIDSDSVETYNFSVLRGVYTGTEPGDVFQFEHKYNDYVQDEEMNYQFVLKDFVETETRTFDPQGFLIEVNGEPYEGNVNYIDRDIFEKW